MWGWPCILNKDKKTVAVMCFSGGCGGMEIDAIKLAGLLQNDCEVTMFCKHGSFIHQQLEHQTRIRYFDIKFVSRTFSISMLLNVRKRVKENNIKNVVFFGASELKTLYFAFLGYDLKVIVRHGTTKSSPKRDWLHRMIYSCVDTHVALSRHLLNNIKMIVPQYPGVKYMYLPQSFKFNEVHVDRGDDACLKIIHVGRVTSGKGQIDAIQACQVLYDNNVKFSLSLLGASDDVEYFGQVKDLVSKVPYRNAIHLEGHVSNVSNYLASSDILLFPSKGEGMPNALIEALHYGIVCITYDNTVFPEFGDMGFSIHTVETGNIDKLKSVLISVALNFTDEYEKASMNISLAKRTFDPKIELENWQSLLV